MTPKLSERELYELWYQIGPELLLGAEIGEQKALFFEAAFHCCTGLILYLLSICGFGLYEEAEMGKTMVHWAAENDLLGVLRHLSETGGEADEFDGRDLSGNTPFFYAVEKGHVEVVKFLLEKGVAFTAKNKFGVMPLHVAAIHNRPKIGLLLLLAGANANSEMISVLAGKVADLSAKDKIGFSAPHWAAQAGNEASVVFLLDRGADPYLKDGNGRAAVDCAKNDKIRDLIRSRMNK
jgi:ankyrin repeat protein